MYAIKLKERATIGQQPYHIFNGKPADWQLEKAKKLKGNKLEKAKEYHNKIAYYQKKLNKLARDVLNED